MHVQRALALSCLNKRPPSADDRLEPSLVLAVRALCFCSILFLSSLTPRRFASPPFFPPSPPSFSLSLVLSSCPLRVGLLINPFVCAQVGIPESRDPTCVGSMLGHTPVRISWTVSTDTLCTSACYVCVRRVCARGLRQNCIFLHRTRFFSHHFVSPQNVRATLEMKTPSSSSRRYRGFTGHSASFYLQIMRARSSRLPPPFKDVTFYRTIPVTMVLY